jgi:hypothetical protein
MLELFFAAFTKIIKFKAFNGKKARFSKESSKSLISQKNAIQFISSTPIKLFMENATKNHKIAFLFNFCLHEPRFIESFPSSRENAMKRN